MNIMNLTRPAAIDRMESIHERFEQLAAKPQMSRADGIEQTELGKEFDALTAHVEKLDRAAQIAACAREGGWRRATDRARRVSARPVLRNTATVP